ncbi:hypothetical protein DI272_18740 [Streptomyces sp. Act143]|uniref:hypothetical protein n=1 Tax=Streptomyces sp. Act143 TaxID=2200760 RepID=UPI000D676434|nr:hypothetical protein [Streptomyces sp. Act143]PWI15973.1 hypothetical protein DI272_18740 [Streptomyces sp. Act143]
MASPAPLTVIVTPGPAREDWCKTCKAWTRTTGDILMLTPGGVSVVGTWTACEICNDEEDDRG